MDTLGQRFARNFVALPASGTRGGILIAVDENFNLHNSHTTEYTVSADITMRADNVSWTLTGVYGPQEDRDKLSFLDEIKGLRQIVQVEWLIVGDFNLIYKAEDKSNDRLNRRLMSDFRQTIDEAQLMEIDLRGRKFTWSNEQDNPTFTRIDRMFGTPEWHLRFPNIDLQPLPTMGSDHCPLFLTGDIAKQSYKGFRFESFWVNMPGFKEVIEDTWTQPVNTQDAILRMHVKLIRTAKALKLWRRQNLGNLQLRLEIVKEILKLLDGAQEQRVLTPEELEFRRFLKAKSLNLAAIQRSRARQHSRLTWLRKGDACTRLFMLHANNRRKKHFIPSLATASGIASSHQRKEVIVFDHFVNLLGKAQERSLSFNWANLGYQPHNLSELEDPFEEEEIKNTVMHLPAEKSPGPDGFIGLFYKKCWSIIGKDLTAALQAFHSLKTRRLELVNEANIILLPKKEDASSVSDYRPISLINSLAKLITKILADRLAPKLNDLVSGCQNAFIKKRCIHDNFVYVQNVIKALHKAKRPTLFIKLDISKAFDSISWVYLLETLQALGFGQKWRDWIATLLATSSSRVLLNGTPGKKFKHARGLRQGDPLSPMLFILAIDPLQKMIELAAQKGLINQILPKAAKLRCSLYADDAAIFANPDRLELHNINQLLHVFDQCSGLKVNLSKTEIFPIRCSDDLVSEALVDFPGKVCSFPGKYLGLPLHTRKLRRVDVQPLLDKIGGRLPGWKGKMLSSSGRETLVKCVLTSQPIYHLTVFPAQKWLIKQIDRMRRSFLWKGEEPEKVCGGHCLIKWPTVCTPKDMGGLGILDLERLARALRLRWCWFQWKHDSRPWVGLDIPCDKGDRDLFNASTIVTVGKGNKASFWHSSWVNGAAPKNLAPSLFTKSRRKKFTVQQALHNNFWINQVLPLHSGTEFREYASLWEQISLLDRNPDMEDEIIWRWTSDGEYTTKSAYRIQFVGQAGRQSITPIWKAKAEPKCKFFAWILLHRKILTANNLAKRGWSHDPLCKLCNTTPETPKHLCKDCSYTCAVWDQLVNWLNLHQLPASNSVSSIYRWWKKCRALVAKDNKSFFDGLVIYFWWNIWKERNRRTFRQEEKTVTELTYLIKEDVQQFQHAIEVVN